MRDHIIAPDTYAPPWHFNHAVKVTGGTTVHTSALAGFRPDGSIAAGDVIDQAENAFENLRRVIREAGGDLSDVVRTVVYVRDDVEEGLDELRTVRARYFTENFPASTFIRVSGFANREYLFQVEAVAIIGS